MVKEISYDFQKIEKKWQKKWEEGKIFCTQGVPSIEDKAEAKPGKKKFYVLDMFPYPSGAGLHMGHAFTFSLGDIFARFKRLQGFNVLYPVGYDSLGLPAENAAIKAGTHPEEYTKKAIVNFMKQEKAMGWSYDWSRLVNTSQPDYYKWDQWIFLKMFEKGLAYRKKAPVNYCPKCDTVLANEQVTNGKCWRHEDVDVEIKHLEQWFFKITDYAEELIKGLDKVDWPERSKAMQKNWIGKSFGVEIGFEIDVEKIILVDGINCLVDGGGNVNTELKDYLDSLPNKKIVLTNAPLEKCKSCFKDIKDYEIFTLEHKIEKIDSDYYGTFLKKYNLDSSNVIYFEHKKEAVKSAEKVGIKSFYYKGNLEDLRNFVNDNSHYNFPIFTTRPDTIYGVTFMVVSAQHTKLMELVTDKQKKEVESFLKKIKSVSEKELEDLEKEGAFTGSYAINPVNNEKVPVYVGNFVVADYGSGMVMAVPAHDQRDFEFAKKYKLPIKEVIKQEKTCIITISESLKKEFYEKVKQFAKISEDDGLSKIYTEEVDKVFNLAKKSFVGGPWYIHSEGKVKKILIYSKGENKIFNWGNEIENKKAKKFGLDKEIKEEQLDYDKLYRAFTDKGILINSSEFNGIENDKAKDEITNFLQKKKLGKRSIQYKLRDWLISRQRYWGTPIPIVYCDKCGIIPVDEKDLPIKLPKDVKFGKGNPLLTNEKWIKTKCPKCKGDARRETDTMDTFVNSSWYYLRYTDSQNKRKIFDEKKANYWAPIDQYIGGPEHITMHLIYIRFYTKFLRDLGLLKFDEPALRYFTQGIVKGSDGEKMSKSRPETLIEPLEMIKKYGADSLRLYLVSNSSPDTDFDWDDKGIKTSFKFLNNVYNYFEKFRPIKTNPKVESKLNKTIKEVTEYITNFKHNLAIIRIRELFRIMEKENVDKKSAESFLKILHVYCPFITEELWHNLGNKSFVSLESWPKVDEKKINEKFEEQEKAQDKLVEDIGHIINLINKDVKKVYVYVLPQEKETYDLEDVAKRVGKEVEIFAVNDKDKFDPEGKSKKVKPGRPGVYLE